MLGGVFASLGRFAYRRRVPVVLVWVLLLAVGLAAGGQVFGRLGTGSGLRDDAESVVVSDLLIAAGAVPLRRDGWNKVQAGLTTVEEVLRVVQG